MRWSTNKRLHLEMGLIQAVHSLAEANISDIIRALNGAPLPEIPVAAPAAPAPVAMPAPMPEPAPAPAPAPEPMPEPAPLPADLQPIDDAPPVLDEPLPEPMPADDMPVLRALTPELWDRLMERLHEQSPVKAAMLGNTLFIGDDDGLVTVGIHPADTETRDLLLGDSLGELIQELAAELCGRRITLRLVADETVPPPVAEEPPPPLPMPVAAPKPAPKPAPKAEEKAPAPAPASHKPTDEEFYHDPLVELALKEFHARLLNE